MGRGLIIMLSRTEVEVISSGLGTTDGDKSTAGKNCYPLLSCYPSGHSFTRSCSLLSIALGPVPYLKSLLHAYYHEKEVAEKTSGKHEAK